VSPRTYLPSFSTCQAGGGKRVGPCTRAFTARDGIGSPNTSATKSLGSLMIIHQRVFENAFSNGQIVIKSRLRCAQGARARREET
jgi:hypothetical protein